MPYNVWTENEIFILKLEWEKGTSARDIAIHWLGRSRNAIIGKANRLHFISPHSPKIKVLQFMKNLEAAKERKRERDRQRKRGARALRKLKKEAGIEPIVTPAPKNNNGKSVAKPPMFFAEPTPIVEKIPIGIMELNKYTCRAIVGRGNDGLAVYCGDQTFPGESWCPGHHKIYFRSPERMHPGLKIKNLISS